jgi:hypothetical protein
MSHKLRSRYNRPDRKRMKAVVHGGVTGSYTVCQTVGVPMRSRTDQAGNIRFPNNDPAMAARCPPSVPCGPSPDWNLDRLSVCPRSTRAPSDTVAHGCLGQSSFLRGRRGWTRKNIRIEHLQHDEKAPGQLGPSAFFSRSLTQVRMMAADL